MFDLVVMVQAHSVYWPLVQVFITIATLNIAGESRNFQIIGEGAIHHSIKTGQRI